MRKVKIEVAFATAEKQRLLELTIDADATVSDAISRSRIADEFPDDDLDSAAVGIWGREVDRGRIVRDGDRVEIYRPLRRDPREARRLLAQSGKTATVNKGT